MTRTHLSIALAAVGFCALGTAPASALVIDGLVANPRVFNDDPASTLSLTVNNSNPGNASIRDEFSVDATGANRHDVAVSADGGLTAYVHGIDDSFTFQTELVLTAGVNSPRKEAGIRINSPVTGDALLLVNSDAGEIVAFGGGFPFHSFGNNAGLNGYTPGDRILLGLTYLGGGDGVGGNPSTVQYFIDRFDGAGVITSPTQPVSNLEGGALMFQVALYAQGGAAGGGFMDAQFTNTTYTVIPEPTAALLTLLGLAGGALGVRRR